MARFDLAALAVQRGYRRDEAIMRPIEMTMTQERELQSIYMDIANAWAEGCRRLLIPAYVQPAPLVQDADGGQLQWLINQIEREVNDRIIYQTDRLGRWVTGTASKHTAKTISAAKSATGVDISPFIRLSDVSDLMQNAIRENTALISNLSQDAKRRVEQVIFDGFARRKTKAQITREIADAMGISRRRARNIATDQAHKLQSLLTQYRNEQMEIDAYRWRTMRDERVRKAHAAREGKRFAWNKPPPDGHPGYPINCRCSAESILDMRRARGVRRG